MHPIDDSPHTHPEFILSPKLDGSPWVRMCFDRTPGRIAGAPESSRRAQLAPWDRHLCGNFETDHCKDADRLGALDLIERKSEGEAGS